MGMQIVSMVILGSLVLAGCKDPPLVYAEPACMIDNLNGNTTQSEVRVTRTKPLHLGGWAIDPVSRRAADSISINLVSVSADISKVYEGKFNSPRPDIVAAFQTEASQVAGFDIDVPINSMTPGLYEIHISQTFSNRTLVCRIPRIIIVE